MPLDPAARRFLAAAGAPPSPHEVPLAQFRRAGEQLVRPGPPEAVERVTDLVIPGGDGQPLRARCYQPASTGMHALVVWLHGGSFVRGGLDTFDAARRAYANLSGCRVLAVDQRLAPEARYPAALEDAYAAARWALEHAGELGADPALVGVAGESSGGNLAAATTLLARHRREPALAFQLLFTPILDATLSSPSVAEFASGYLLTREQLAWAYDQYAPGVPRDESLLSPLHEPDLAGLPPAVVITVEYDPARDEAERYAERLASVGVPVKRARIDGMLHHFPGPDALNLAARLTRELLTTELFTTRSS